MNYKEKPYIRPSPSQTSLEHKTTYLYDMIYEEFKTHLWSATGVRDIKTDDSSPREDALIELLSPLVNNYLDRREK